MKAKTTCGLHNSRYIKVVECILKFWSQFVLITRNERCFVFGADRLGFKRHTAGFAVFLAGTLEALRNQK